YEALSYRWGDEKSEVTIMIEGQLITVTPNLSMALADAQPTIKDSPLWVDALCIDQHNILERNHQVQKMATIYRKASRVHAWLGMPDKQNSNKGDSRVETLLSAIQERQYVADWISLAAGTELPYWNRLWIVQEIGLA
ncbi:heterokaryon incompatibility, partial [Hyaloscypha bicolor E]